MRQSKVLKELIEKRAVFIYKFNTYRQERIRVYESQRREGWN